MPLAAIRAFEAAARLGRISAAAEELGITHSAVSRHVSQLEQRLGVPLFEGPRSRPGLTVEGQTFGFALTSALDQIEAAYRMVSRSDDMVLDVACLGTFAMRWLIPRLQDFSAKYPRYTVRFSTSERPSSVLSDLYIDILPKGSPVPPEVTVLFPELIAPVVAAAIAHGSSFDALKLPRMATRTRPNAWREWLDVSGSSEQRTSPISLTFDHYHLTIEGVLNGLGCAIAPWHLVADEVTSGRLLAPFGFAESGNRYIVASASRRKRKTDDFIQWLKAAAAEMSWPDALPCASRAVTLR